jgi:hypothetical protein
VIDTTLTLEKACKMGYNSRERKERCKKRANMVIFAQKKRKRYVKCKQ